MRKTDTFFVIHNFNTVPEELVGYCRDYIIYDASTDPKVTAELEKRGYHYMHIENTGHNITTYFQYFSDYYDSLPEYVCLCKGNMLKAAIARRNILTVFTITGILHFYMKIRISLRS